MSQKSPAIPYAIRALEASFPPGEYVYRTEEPTITIDTRKTFLGGKRSLTPDIAIYKNGQLVAVVEVGSLSIPDKLQLLEQGLPGVMVYWIPKVDLLPMYAPDMMRFRFLVTKDGDDSLPVRFAKIGARELRIERASKAAIKFWEEIDSILCSVGKLTKAMVHVRIASKAAIDLLGKIGSDLDSIEHITKAVAHVRNELKKIRAEYESTDFGAPGIPLTFLDEGGGIETDGENKWNREEIPA